MISKTSLNYKPLEWVQTEHDEEMGGWSTSLANGDNVMTFPENPDKPDQGWQVWVYHADGSESDALMVSFEWVSQFYEKQNQAFVFNFINTWIL